MIFQHHSDFLRSITISDKWSLLGLDVGNKKIGVACASSSANVVLPLYLITGKNLNQQIDNLVNLINDREISGLVIGWPLEMSGNVGAQADTVKKFADKLLTKKSIPIYLQDERMSTALANRLLMDSSLTRRQKSDVDDQLSAALILDSFLMLLRSTGQNS